MGNVLHFYLYSDNHQSFGQSKRLSYFIYDGREIFMEAMRIFDAIVGNGLKPFPTGGLKLIGVTVSWIQPYIHQLSLFGSEERKKRLAEALDKINEKYGDFTVCRAPVLQAGKVFRDSIGFGRMKEL